MKEEKKKIKIGDIRIELSKLGLDFYIEDKNRKVCWLNVAGVKKLKKFLDELYKIR